MSSNDRDIEIDNAMDTANRQNEGGSRRRSMLPQKAALKPGSTPLASLSEKESIGSGQQPITLEKPKSPTLYEANSDAAKTHQPAKVGRSRSVRESTKEQTAKSQASQSTTRKPSAGRPSSHETFATPAPKRATSGSSNVRTTGKAPFHGRSVSQQLDPKATPRLGSIRTPSLRQSFMNNQKPAFSALQQLFTPKKAKSRPTSPSTQPLGMDKISTADIFHVQMELAQLHLLHRSAATVQKQWEGSAKDSFQQRFTALHERHIDLKDIAHQQQILINQLGLVSWSQGKTGTQIAEKLQLLSRNISDVSNLIDAEGKYTRILEIFESWFTRALDIRGKRDVKAAKTGKDLGFNEGLGDGWKAEAMVLERELTYCLRDLKGFGILHDGSSLGRILSLYSRLVVSMLEELDVIQWIENEIMVQETCWVERTIHNLASNVSEDIGSIASTRPKV